MNEVIVQTLVDKVEGQEGRIRELQGQLASQQKALEQGQAHVDAIEKECKTILQGISFPVGEMHLLSGQLAKMLLQLKMPIRTEVTHHHHLHKGGWMVGGCLLVTLLLAVMLVRTHFTLSQYREHDLKYRYLELISEGHVQQALLQGDRYFLKSAKDFEQLIDQKQEQRLESTVRPPKKSSKERKRVKEKRRSDN